MERQVAGIFDDAACEWIHEVADELGTDDHRYAHRVLQTWLHMVRAGITDEAAAAFAAGLPPSIRGDFYADRDASAVFCRGGAAACTIRFGRRARIAVQDVSHAASSTTVALCRLLAPTEVQRALDELTPEIRALITNGPRREAS